MQNSDLFNGTHFAIQFAEVADFEWAEQDEHDTRRKVRQRIFESQTNGQTCGTEQGNERSRIDTKL